MLLAGPYGDYVSCDGTCLGNDMTCCNTAKGPKPCPAGSSCILDEDNDDYTGCCATLSADHAVHGNQTST